MDSKKKKKVIVVSIILAILLLAATIIGIVLGIRAHNNKGQTENNASNMGTTTETNTYNEAIAKNKVPQNYDGVYVYKSISRIEFSKELTEKDIEKICINKTSKPYINDLLTYLNTERIKIRDDQKEKLVFSSNNNYGSYCKNINDNPLDPNSDYGSYVGDDNLARITTEKTILFISLNYSDINNNIPVKDSQNKDQRKIYVMENIYSNSIDNPNRLLFTVTYVYELIDEEIKTIPDSELDFDIKI